MMQDFSTDELRRAYLERDHSDPTGLAFVPVLIRRILCAARGHKSPGAMLFITKGDDHDEAEVVWSCVRCRMRAVQSALVRHGPGFEEAADRWVREATHLIHLRVLVSINFGRWVTFRPPLESAPESAGRPKVGERPSFTVDGKSPARLVLDPSIRTTFTPDPGGGTPRNSMS